MYITTIVLCPEASLAGGWGFVMYLTSTVRCPEASFAGGWGFVIYLYKKLKQIIICRLANVKCASSGSLSYVAHLAMKI